MAMSTETLQAADVNPFFKGSLSLTNITDLVQFLTSSYKSG